MQIPSTDSGNFGDLLKLVEILSIFGTGLLVVFKVGRATERFELIGQQQAKEITELKDAVKAVAAAQASALADRARVDNQGAIIAATQQRQDLLEKRLYELSHGRGFVQGAVDGEYPPAR